MDTIASADEVELQPTTQRIGESSFVSLRVEGRGEESMVRLRERAIYCSPASFLPNLYSSQQPSLMELDSHSIRAISLWLSTQHLAMDRQSRREHSGVASGGEPDLNGDGHAGFDSSGQSNIKTSKADVIEHRLDLEPLATLVLAANFRREAIMDSRAGSPLGPAARGGLFRSFNAGAVCREALNGRILS